MNCYNIHVKTLHCIFLKLRYVKYIFDVCSARENGKISRLFITSFRASLIKDDASVYLKLKFSSECRIHTAREVMTYDVILRMESILVMSFQIIYDYMPCSLVFSWKVVLYRLEYSFSQTALSGFAEIFMWKVVDGKISYNQLSRTSSGRITRFYTLRTRPSTVQSFSNPQILHPMFTFNQLRKWIK